MKSVDVNGVCWTYSKYLQVVFFYLNFNSCALLLANYQYIAICYYHAGMNEMGYHFPSSSMMIGTNMPRRIWEMLWAAQGAEVKALMGMTPLESVIDLSLV